MDKTLLKIQAAEKALTYVEQGMWIGLGTGSTANEFIKLLAKKIHAGLSVQAVSTSHATSNLCREVGIVLHDIDTISRLDLVVDGADEVTPDLNLLKGGGGALLREKIIAQCSDKVIIIADESKLVPQLGNFPLPIEINKFGAGITAQACKQFLQAQGLQGNFTWRKNPKDEFFVTDEGHYILDAALRSIEFPAQISEGLLAIAGVVEHGLFLDMAELIIIASRKDGVRLLKRANNSVISRP